MVRIEFVEKLKFITNEKFEVLSSTSIAIRNWDSVLFYIDNVICPTESAKEEILDRIGKLTINKGFFLGGCKDCKYIRLVKN